jgi:hypothetical protein
MVIRNCRGKLPHRHRLDGERLAAAYYNTVVDQPYYYLEYAGRLQRTGSFIATNRIPSEIALIKSVLENVSRSWAVYYEQLREQKDVWADGLLEDAA